MTENDNKLFLNVLFQKYLEDIIAVLHPHCLLTESIRSNTNFYQTTNSKVN